jgi:protein-tyrosine phosphatase
MREILFLCTGNYYRSRFAEAWFNHAAARRGLAWRAFSRGLAVHLAPPRGLSPHAALRLRAWRMPGGLTAADPAQVTPADLERATRIVALKEAEHRPLLAQLHPAWEKRIEYWAIDDLDSAPSAVALDAIEARVNHLLEELANSDDPGAYCPGRR